MRVLASAIGAVLTSVLLLGCADDGLPGTNGPGGKGDEIFPEADENLGYLEVTLPAAARIDPVHMRFLPDIDGSGGSGAESVYVAPGQPVRVKKGTGQLIIEPAFRPHRPLQSVTATITAGRTTRLELALASFVYDDTQAETLRADFGPWPTLHLPRVHVELGAAGRFDAATLSHAFAGAGATHAIVLPGAIKVEVEGRPGAARTVSVAPGSVHRLEVDRPVPTLASAIGTVRVRAPERRLPDAVVTRQQGQPGWCHAVRATPRHVLIINATHRRIDNTGVVGSFVYDDPTTFCWAGTRLQAIHPDQPNYVQKAMTLPPDGADVRMYPLYGNNPADASTFGGAQYELVVSPFFAVTVTPRSGEVVEIPVKRIDVHHVRVTREDGSVYEAVGRYEVYAWRDGAWAPVTFLGDPEAVSFETGSGIDVLPGRYRVEVTAVTAEGIKRSTHHLDL
jgi:hypothetical protein